MVTTVRGPVLNRGVNVKDYGAKGDGVTNDSTAIQNAINTGDTVYIPTGTYRLVTGLTMSGESKLIGAGINDTILQPVGAITAITMGTYCQVSDLTINGTGDTSAMTGIDLRDTGFSTVERVAIGNSGNTMLSGIGIKTGLNLGGAAVPPKPPGTFRCKLDQVYIEFCDVGISVHTDTTNSLMIGGRIGSCDSNFIKSSGVDASFNFIGVNIESNSGTIGANINANEAGSPASNNFFIFDKCHFEDNGGGAGYKLISHSSTRPLIVRDCVFGEPASATTGTAYDIYEQGNLLLEGNHFIQNAAAPSYTRRFIFSIGNDIPVTRIHNLYLSENVTATDVADMIDRDTSTRILENTIGDRIFGSSGSGLALNSAIVPYTKSTTDASTSGTGEDDLRTTTLYSRELGLKNGVKVFAAGTKTGSAGNKTEKLVLGSTTIATIGPANDTNDWSIEAEIWNDIGTGSQNYRTITYNGSTVAHDVGTASENTLNDLVLKITGECADGADTITQTMWRVEIIG
jgi:hypothetical protein